MPGPVARAARRLRDYAGRIVRTGDLRGESAGPTSDGRRSVWADALPGAPDPAALGAILREAETPGDGHERRYLALAELMLETDPHLAGAVQTRRRQVAQIPVVVEPASDSADDAADADLVRDALADIDTGSLVYDLLGAVVAGWSVCEIVWSAGESDWRPDRIEWRYPQWFSADRIGGERLQRLDEQGRWRDLEPWKFIVHRYRGPGGGIPIRGGLARLLAWPWLMRAYALRDWTRFAEAYGQPVRLGKYGPHSTDADRETLYRAVRDLAPDGAAIVPDDMMIELIGDGAAQGRAEIYRDLIAHLDAQTSIAVLGQTLTTQEGQSGSYSLGQVHDRVRGDIESADAVAVARTIERDLVVPIVALNRGPRRRYPRIVIERERAADIDAISRALSILVPLGLDVRRDDARAMLGLQAPGPDDDILAPPGAQPDPDPDADPDEDAGRTAPAARRAGGLDIATARALVSFARAEARSDDPIDVAADRLAAGWRPLVEPLTDPVLRAAAESDSYDALAARLDSAGLWRETDRGPLADALYRAIFAARISGAG